MVSALGRDVTRSDRARALRSLRCGWQSGPGTGSVCAGRVCAVWVQCGRRLQRWTGGGGGIFHRRLTAARAPIRVSPCRRGRDPAAARSADTECGGGSGPVACSCGHEMGRRRGPVVCRETDGAGRRSPVTRGRGVQFSDHSPTLNSMKRREGTNDATKKP